MSLLSKKIREYKLSQEIIDVYRDHLTDESITGYIADFNKEFILLNCFTDEGENDGVSLFYIDDITRIRAKGNIRKSIKELSQHGKTEFKSYKIDLKSKNSILKSVNKVFGHVCLHTEGMDNQICFIGSIKDEDKEWIVLDSFGTMTSRDIKQLILRKDEISRIDAGGKYEKAINYLATFKKNTKD